VTHPLYEGVIQKMLGGINQSTEAAEIANEIYLAATDGADQLR